MNKAIVKNIRIADKLYIDKEGIQDVDYLISLFTYTHELETFTDIQEEEDYFTVPSNAYWKLEWETLIDERNFTPLDYILEFSGTLRPEQQDAADQLIKDDRARSGILQAKCSWGKTFTASSLIATNNTKTMVLLHTKMLFRQWIKELENLIPNCKIGRIGDGLFEVEDITVGIYKTVYNNLDKLRDEFSMVIVDEAHLCGAEMFSTALHGLNAKIKIGITATPKRKDGKHVFFPDYFTKHIVFAKDTRVLATPSIKIQKTDFKFTVIDPKRDWARQINKLSINKNYMELIANTTISYIKNGRCPLILSDRVQMLKDLNTMIPSSILMIGSTSEADREEGLANVGNKYKAVLSTKLFDEGISCHRLDTLILTCPNNNPIKMEQRIGRIEREHPEKQLPLVHDFWLVGKMVERQQNNRLDWYKQRGYHIL